ncbi:hypothetical protein ACLB2K_010831 [Fragaria x ananassa]
MFMCKCFYRNQLNDLCPPEPEPFSLPAPIPKWPPGEGFASGKIIIGEIEVSKISKFERIWTCSLPEDKKKCVTFYKPVGIPDGFRSMGHYCQLNGKPLHGYVLVVREVELPETAVVGEHAKSAALREPLDYTLVWSPDDGTEESYGSCGYFWLPDPPEGYRAMGFLVTNKPGKPELDEVRCVRADLTDTCEPHNLIFNSRTNSTSLPFQVWTMRPRHRGTRGTGVSVGTFFCSNHWSNGEDLQIGCLKNLNPKLCGMPNLDQIHSLINHYGPTVFFHPDEVYLPSSVAWFFKNGALLYKTGTDVGEAIDESGSNLPGGGSNDRQFWIDLPSGDQRKNVIHGNLESAKLYVHVKPALGGTFTDIAMWVFCPFNGPATLKVGPMDITLSKIGQHVGDWEHFTLRICNFTGELCSIYFSQHSGGQWVDAYALEYIRGNKAIIYSTKNGHASFPHAGTYLQGSSKLGIGIRNDADRSEFSVDSSIQYEVVAAEYLGEGVVTEPGWLQFMREWGPKIVYNSRTELDKIINVLPAMLRYSLESIFSKIPVELSGEEGPTGPKEKNNWVGDERW